MPRTPAVRVPTAARNRTPLLTPGDPSLPITEWSITVVKRGTHIPSVWLRRVNDWFRHFALAGAASIEAGGRNGYLHVQAVGRVRMVADEAGRKAIRQHIKSFIPVQHGSGGTIDAKPLEAGQTWVYMLGYIQKDQGMPHYSLLSHNVSPNELQEGRKSYADVRVDFVDGRIGLNKANLIKHMYTFWTRDIAPLRLPPDHILKYMLRSGAYMPLAVWTMSPQGRGILPAKFAAMWDLVTGGLENCDVKSVRKLFFDYTPAEEDRAIPVDNEWNYSLPELLRAVRMLRNAENHEDLSGPALEMADRPRQSVAPAADSSSDSEELPDIDWEEQFGSDAVGE